MPFRVHGFLVHAGTVEISDFLIDRVAARAAGGSLLQNLMLDVAIVLANLHEAAPPRLVSRNLGALDPVAAGVLIEIDAGINALVDRVETEARRGFSGGRCLREANDTYEKQKERPEPEQSHTRSLLFVNG